MTGCIVGFAHSPFGKLDTETVESLVVRVANDALKDAGIEARDVDEQSSARFSHRPRCCHLPHGESQRLKRIGHHLLMADGDVDVVLVVAGFGDGEKRGDRPALDDFEVVVDQAPFDVLGVAEMSFDPPAQLSQAQHLGISQRRLVLPLRRDGSLPRSAGG